MISIKISGSLTSRNTEELKIDWWGGSSLILKTDYLIGEWDTLQIGDWFNAKIQFTDAVGGKIEKAIFNRKIQPPKYMTDEELTEAYSKIPIAKLEPVD